MALFTDTNVIALDDLLQFESSLTQVSTTHGIDIQTKINLAVGSIGDKILLGLLRAGQYTPFSPYGVTLGLQSVIVTPALRRWLCFDSLSRVFAEAYNVQLNTRFQGKWTEYQKEAQAAESLVTAAGLAIALHPLPRPLMPTFVVGQGSISAAAIFIQTAWVDSQGRESAPSAINGSVLNGFSSVQIQIIGDGSAPPTYASGWNVYASLTQQNLMMQNLQPLAIGTNWQMPTAGLSSGPNPSGGQKPDLTVSLSGRLQRG